MSYKDDPQWLISLIEKCGPNCWYCGAEIARARDIDPSTGEPRHGKVRPTRDHVRPRSKRGSNRRHNLVLSCEPCNTKKGSLTLDEFRRKLENERRGRVTFYGEQHETRSR